VLPILSISSSLIAAVKGVSKHDTEFDWSWRIIREILSPQLRFQASVNVQGSFTVCSAQLELSWAIQAQYPTTITMQALYGGHSTAACLQQQRPLRLKAAIVPPSMHLKTCNALLVSSQNCSRIQLSGSSSSSTSRSRISQTATRSQAQEQVDLQTSESQLVGEDAASFDFSKQSLQSWGIFVALLSTVLGALYLVSKLASLE
jgi:hypothetical protein